MRLPQTLVVELLSDTAWSRGEGTAGEVDSEVEHNDLGLPFVGGKTLHGLLLDAWLTMSHAFSDLQESADRVLGTPQDLSEHGILRVGDALLDAQTHAWVDFAVNRQDKPLTPNQILRALTDIRRQTAEDRETGAPERTTLRATRVVLRGITFHAPLTWLATDTKAADLQALALCALSVRHAGLARNRGCGHIALSLDGDREWTRELAGVK